MGHWERPMITNFAIRLGEFWLEHWKWIIPTGIMLAAVIVNALKH
jgi:signal transduction histidine kinase